VHPSQQHHQASKHVHKTTTDRLKGLQEVHSDTMLIWL